MYENYTAAGKLAMEDARKEASRFNHEYIGTEHILLGLVKSKIAVVCEVFSALDIHLRRVRVEVERLVQPAPDSVDANTLLLSPRAKRALSQAEGIMGGRNHPAVSSSDLLLALLHDKESVAAQVLMNLGIDLAEMQTLVDRLPAELVVLPENFRLTKELVAYYRRLRDEPEVNEANISELLDAHRYDLRFARAVEADRELRRNFTLLPMRISYALEMAEYRTSETPILEFLRMTASDDQEFWDWAAAYADYVKLRDL